MVKVMIADDNISLNQSCCKFLANDKNIKIVSKTSDGKSTLNNYLSQKPDVLILDLDLPTINGLEIINHLCTYSDEKNKCNIIVISGNCKMRSELYNTSKVYKIIPKPFQFNYILETIKEMYPKNISEKELKNILIELKFNLYSKGTLYLIDAINLCYDSPTFLRNTKHLYIEIADKYNVTWAQVKWSIRNSIDAMNKYLTIDTMYSIFHIRDYNFKITPKFFLEMLVEYFKN